MTIANIAACRVTMDGKDLTDIIRPRLQSLTITEKRGDEADQLDIVLDDSDGGIALPSAGVILQVELGWLQGSAVKPGLIDKGRFKVDEVEHSGAPDIITIRARSADFASSLRTRREKSWHDTTIGAIVSEVAKKNKLQARCAPALASIAVKTHAQSRESDMAFLRRLGREHDAVATIKQGALIFLPIGAGQTPSGRTLPLIEIARSNGDRHAYRIEKREEAGGVSAQWHDRGEAKRKTVTVGSADSAKKLSRVYASEAEAQRAAKAARARAARQPVTLSLNLALGRPDIFPEQKTRVSGFKEPINMTSWLVQETIHTLSEKGLVTSLKLENLP
ncbi:contractile injection system protein, VgrG/Pvc8 family [Sphingomonas sp. QA11]|uniref:contractile injection system protein, VgrG/Pvc8 family n=1 Tax=Sphingomonas sp. QA11 TaxID=2950605 RepID=UPI00234AEB17|nr:contractile injection system protein, VgrG/Pvc8 family [Sphingomonas sp. QA11]WCM29208.1 contractile injection system protein, VgrG/Pvc8 family [Sphingomonas sp. QA11]